jgi:hypothetical protein
MKLSEQAIGECVRELKAACRLPIKNNALLDIISLVRQNFEEQLDDPAEGPRRWVRDGPKLRDNGRFMGALAEFFTNREGKTDVGFGELLAALLIVQVKCSAGTDELRYCQNAAPDYDATRLLISDFLNQMSRLPAK